MFAVHKRDLHLFVLAWIVPLLALSAGVRADYLSDVGYTQLANELGAALPKGAGIRVAQVEASNSDGSYAPSPLSGKTYTYNGGSTYGFSTYSSHATAVASYYYSSAGLSPNVTNVDVWDANSYLSNSLRVDSSGSQAPLSVSYRVQNDSWVGTYNNNALDQDTIRRLDYAIATNGFTAAVGENNGATGTPYNLLSTSYNAIVVGLSNGNSTPGPTTFEGAGRSKPDIVAPMTATSWATPLVGSAAALLLSEADSAGYINAQSNAPVIKSILLAGASKSALPSWTRSSTQPLDQTYGAGQLNLYNSYHILTAGEQEASTSITVGAAGWDYAVNSSTGSGGGKYYFFDVAANTTMTFSAILAWNRSIGTNWANQGESATLANLDLGLYAATGFTVGGSLDSSLSTVDNVECLFDTLSAGRYAMKVWANDLTSNYGLAWQGFATPSLIPGDANGDGRVDGADFDIWFLHLGLSGAQATWANGNFNGDQNIDGADFDLWFAHLGDSALQAGFVPLGAVPEPASLGLLVSGGLVLLPLVRGQGRGRKG